MDEQHIFPAYLLGAEPPPDAADDAAAEPLPPTDPTGNGEAGTAGPEVPSEDSDHEPRHWWALYTRARQEKALARELFGWEIPFYLPLIPKTRAYGRRRVQSTIPLFAGYLFLYGSDAERVKSLTTNRVSRNLEVQDGPELAAELRNLKRLIDSGAPLTIESRLAAGARVRIRRGPLAGVEGVVLKRHGETRLLVSVNFLQQGASVAIEDFLLDPL